MKTYKLDSPNHILCLEAANLKEEDIKVFTYLANQLVARFMAICDQPFNVDIGEAEKGGEDHILAIIGTVDEAGELVVDPLGEEELTEVKGRQLYAAKNLKDAEEDYLGVVSINALMRCPKAKDEDEFACENIAAHTLLDLTFMQYYVAIAEICDDWRTEYIDAPACESAILAAHDRRVI